MYPIFNAEYAKEKKHLEDVAVGACKMRGEYCEPIYTIYPADKDNKIVLTHWGRDVNTTIKCIWLNECDEMAVASMDEDSEEIEYDMLSEFSNDEMKKILEVCGIEY